MLSYEINILHKMLENFIEAKGAYVSRSGFEAFITWMVVNI